MLQLRPGSGVGPFELGMTSRAAIELIRNENRNADIVYEAADPNSHSDADGTVDRTPLPVWRLCAARLPQTVQRLLASVGGTVVSVGGIVVSVGGIVVSVGGIVVSMGGAP